MTDLHDLTVVGAARAIREREVSAEELMSALLARCGELEPQLRVWVTLDEEAAIDAARLRDRELAAEGPRGPLHGVPVGVKDIYYTRGVKTTACSAILADFVPDYDSTAIVKLRQAGAIIMGKTVTTEFACGDPPPTRNPWNHEHTPGGSSSGSAVGVIAKMFPAALGSQTGGSVLRPASFNGVVGLKPTFGRDQQVRRRSGVGLAGHDGPPTPAQSRTLRCCSTPCPDTTPTTPVRRTGRLPTSTQRR